MKPRPYRQEAVDALNAADLAISADRIELVAQVIPHILAAAARDTAAQIELCEPQEGSREACA